MTDPEKRSKRSVGAGWPPTRPRSPEGLTVGRCDSAAIGLDLDLILSCAASVASRQLVEVPLRAFVSGTSADAATTPGAR